jgi:hypothetical protein
VVHFIFFPSLIISNVTYTYYSPHLITVMENEWNPEEFGFFYPDAPLSWGMDEIVVRDYITYYRSANAFARRLRSSYARSSYDDRAHICRNLPSCLRGKANSWWLIQRPITRAGLVNCGDIEQWCQVLLRAFKLSPDEAFVAFDAIRYTVRDALNRRYPDAYTFFLISAAEECGIPEADFAMWAWLHLEYPLRCLIPRPKKGVTILGFTRVLYQVINREYWEKTSDPPAQPSQRIQPMQPAMSAVISQTPFRPASPADTSSNTLSEGTVM